MPRTILVFTSNKNFKIEVPDDAKVTFAPWSPPTEGGWRGNGSPVGTLRIYKGSKENGDVMGVFSGVHSFRDIDLHYEEEAVILKGATVWHDDNGVYHKETDVARTTEWVVPELGAPDA